MSGQKASAESSAPAGGERGLIDAARREADGISRWAGGATHADHPYLRPPPPDSFPGYEIIRAIHRGGQGVVYQAVQTATRRDVAIKVVRNSALAGPRERTRFELEVQILGQFDHPNIVTIHDSGTLGDCAYGVMDYIPGLPLDEHVALEARSVKSTLKLFVKICEAVNVAHLRGVIHRDLKPGNIRVDHSGEPHILDFGLAKVSEFDVLAQTEARTIEGQFVGSLPWASPEQAEGSADLDIRTDVYSLGVILYQMLTGRFPYVVSGRMREVIEQITGATPAPPRSLRRDIDDEVETIILNCLSKERERRYQGAGELARDVQRYLANEPIESKRDSGWYVLRKTLKRYRVRTSVAAAFVVLTTLSAVSLAFLYQRAGREAEVAMALNAVLGAYVDSVDPVAPGSKRTLYQVAQTASTQFADRPEQEARVRYLLSIAHWTLTYYGGSSHTAMCSAQALAAAEIQERTLGRGHPDTLRSLQMHVGVLRATGKRDEAEELSRDIVQRTATGLDAQPHPYRVWALTGLGLTLNEAGKVEEAEAVLREGAMVARGTCGPLDVQTWNGMSFLTGVLARQLKWEEAESLVLDWYAEVEAAASEKDEAIWHARTLLRDLYLGWGRPEEAQKYQVLLAQQEAAARAQLSAPASEED